MSIDTEEPWWTVEAVLTLPRGAVRTLCAAEGATEEEATDWAANYWLSSYPECSGVMVEDCYPLVEYGEEEEL